MVTRLVDPLELKWFVTTIPNTALLYSARSHKYIRTIFDWQGFDALGVPSSLVPAYESNSWHEAEGLKH